MNLPKMFELGWTLAVFSSFVPLITANNHLTVLDCFHETKNNNRCLEESLCPNITLGHVCDGFRHCVSGADEDANLCALSKWRQIPCPEGSEVRCSGFRPGQCVSQDGHCDKKYQCLDRSDEDYCVRFKQNPSIDGSEEGPGGDPNPSTDDENNSKTMWILTSIIVGLVLTGIIHHFFIVRYKRWFGTKKPDFNHGSTMSLQDYDNQDIRSMLKFIGVMRTHVKGKEPFKRREKKLMELFRNVHDTPTWSRNAQIIFDMGHLIFESQMNWIDEFHVTMHKLEQSIHLNDELNTNLCLKHDLGNRYASDLFWSSEPPGIRKLECLCPSWFHRFWRSKVAKTIRTYLSIVKETFSYYLDLIKDWAIFAILYLFSRPEAFLDFEAQLLFLLGLFLVVPELIRGGYFAHYYKDIFDLRGYRFNKVAELIFQGILVILSPFIPAVMLFERGKLAFENVKIQTILLERMKKYTDMSVDEISRKDLEGFKSDFDIYHKVLEKRDKFLEIIVDAKYLEASTETIFQYILQLMVLLVVKMAMNIRVTEGLETIFFSEVGTLLYISLAISFISLINGRTGIEAWHKQGFFRQISKVFFGMSTLFALVAKVASIVFYFAPTIGLFRLADPWYKGRIPFAEEFYIGTDKSVSDTWIPTAENFDQFTGVNLGTYYLFYLIFVPIQCLALYIVKQFATPSFKRSRSKAQKLLHIVSCLNFPTIFVDWDEKKSEDIETYNENWEQVRKENKIMTIFHICVNMLNCIPMVYCCMAIIQRHACLVFGVHQPNPEERIAFRVACGLVLSPLYMLILGGIQWKVIMKYYKDGHPWSRIFREMPSNQTPPVSAP